MIIEFEVDTSNERIIDFFKRKRWPVSEIFRKSIKNKIFFSKNTLHYDNFRRLLRQAVILEDGSFISNSENIKHFNKKVKFAQKNGMELHGGYTPSSELIEIVYEAVNLGDVILRIIDDDTDIEKMEVLCLPVVQFNEQYFLHESTEIRFKPEQA